MAGSTWFRRLGKTLRAADFCNRYQIPTCEGLEYLAEQKTRYLSRREFLAGAGKVAAIGAAAMGMEPLAQAIATPPATRSPIKVAIVGAGLAGLACAYELKRKGVIATLFDANDRVGGRCWSLRDFFPGQVAERGGEFIDTPHKTLLGYVKQFKLAVEDVDKQPGEVFYYFNGERYAESLVVDEYRALVPALRDDLRRLSNEPTAANHTVEDMTLDRMSLQEYLDNRGAGQLIKSVIEQAYKAEYGLEIGEQSCLNFLLFIHADRRSKFTPFGIFSDERYHVLDGNDRIAEGLRDRLGGQIRLDMRLVRVFKTATGKIDLSFQQAASTKQAIFDAVVLALPFTTLRDVDLDASLGLPTWKSDAIDLLGYGTNAKMMVGFDSRPWVSLGSNGEAYSNLEHHQLTWETNPIMANASRGVLTDYSSGQRGANLDPSDPQGEASQFLNDLDEVFPGAFAAATRDTRGLLRVHLEHWPSNTLTRGSYTCYRPGQFTSIAGNEGTSVGNLHFAGEHANSFYEWQGFMEGAALSGIQAAQEILQDIKAGQFG
jgi:monoamine oxidase